MENEKQKLERLSFIMKGFSAMNKDNIDDIYSRRYIRYKFDNSDEVSIDGVLLSNDEKASIKQVGYNIRPTPKETIVSDLINGFEITEKHFIQSELILLNNVNYDLLNLKNRLQFTFYKDYLSKKENFSPNINKLSINEIALKLVYEGINVTRENAKEIIKEYGYTSGDALFNKFLRWSNRTDRKGCPETVKKLKNKIELFEKVVEILPEEKSASAKDELKILKSFISDFD